MKLKDLEIREANEMDLPIMISWLKKEEETSASKIPQGIQCEMELLKTELMKQTLNEATGTRRTFIICTKMEHHPIGEISFNQLNPHHKSCEVKMQLHTEPDNRLTYGEEALQGFLDYLVKTYKVHRVSATVFMDDKEDFELYDKVGFKTIGIAHDIFKDSKGEYHHAILMERLYH